MANEKEKLQIKKMPQEVSDDELNAIAGGVEYAPESRFGNSGGSGTGSCGGCK